MKNQPTVVGVVGIDGCGKSTVIERFRTQGAHSAGHVVSMTCPAYHLTPNAPFALLSRQLEALAHSGDALGSHALKAVGMFLQMSLFGPTEQFFVSAYQPQILLTEHHALVDSLAYGPLYAKLLGAGLDRSHFEAVLRQRLESIQAGSFDAVVQWHHTEQRRLGLATDFWTLPEYLGELFKQEPPALLATLSQHYRARLPDVLLFLDVPVNVAIERLRMRSGGNPELHEQPQTLELLRQCFQNLIPWLRQHHPEVKVHVIDTSHDKSVEAVVAEVMDRSGMGFAEIRA